MKIFETERLYLRELTPQDKPELARVLSDPQAMQFYPHPFSDAEVERWIAWNRENYAAYGHGLWAVILKESDVFLGDCGITLQNIGGETVPEIGFHILPEYQGRGYATEAALGCRQYAFQVLGLPAVYSYSRVANLPSQRVAQKIGMRLYKHFEKNGAQQVAQVIEQGE